MRSRFTKTRRPSETLSFQRDDEIVELTVYAIPLGLDVVLEEAIPDSHFINSKRTKMEGLDAARQREQFMYATLGVCMDPDEFDAKRPKGSKPGAWKAYAHALREEFTAAGFVDGDIVRLGAAIKRLTHTSRPAEIEDIEDAAGN
jgi:hypothetical protein